MMVLIFLKNQQSNKLSSAIFIPNVHLKPFDVDHISLETSAVFIN